MGMTFNFIEQKTNCESNQLSCLWTFNDFILNTFANYGLGEGIDTEKYNNF